MTQFFRAACPCFLTLAASLLSALPTGAQANPLAPTNPPATARTATIVVSVSGVHDRRGVLRVNLYRTADGFPADPGKAFQKRDIMLQTLSPKTPLEPLTVTFADLPPGTYAVCSIHDSNGNNKLDTNFVGAPREDFAVSNDVRPRFRAPHFDEASFAVAAGQTQTIAFRVRH